MALPMPTDPPDPMDSAPEEPERPAPRRLEIERLADTTRGSQPRLELERREETSTADATYRLPDRQETRTAHPARRPAQGAGPPVAWKAAASSVPRLRQQPTPAPLPAAESAFPGFAQDVLPGSFASASGEHHVPGAAANPAAAAASPPERPPRLRGGLLGRLRRLSPAAARGAGALLLLAAGALFLLLTRAGDRVSLARIRQHPEAFDGRSVKVRGRAGESFSIGGSYVFTLHQGRDTVVVYSRARRPVLNETVRVTGVVSIGYLDGVPRVALLEQPPAP